MAASSRCQMCDNDTVAEGLQGRDILIRTLSVVVLLRDGPRRLASWSYLSSTTMRAEVVICVVAVSIGVRARQLPREWLLCFSGAMWTVRIEQDKNGNRYLDLVQDVPNFRMTKLFVSNLSFKPSLSDLLFSKLHGRKWWALYCLWMKQKIPFIVILKSCHTQYLSPSAEHSSGEYFYQLVCMEFHLISSNIQSVSLSVSQLFLFILTFDL